MKTSFERVNDVWSDLDTFYAKSGNGVSKLDFVKRLLMVSKGEAAFRNLISKISEDCSEVQKADSQALIQKLQIAMESVKRLDELNQELIKFDDLFVDQTNASSVSLDMFSVAQKQEIYDIHDQLKTGSLLPVVTLGANGIQQPKVQQYLYVLESPAAVANLVTCVKRGIVSDLPVLKAVGLCQDFLRKSQRNLLLPCIVTNSATFDVIAADPQIQIMRSDLVVSDPKLKITLHSVKDKYSTVSVVCINEF